MIVELAVAAVAGFALGSIPFAVLVARAFGLADPRQHGSGNPGATNVMRSGNRLAGRLVFGLDFAKGAVATALGLLVAGPAAAAAAAIGSVLGHVFSPLLSFRGGKGVATGFGAILAIDWQLFAVAVGAFAVVYAMLRMVGMASVIGMVAAAATAVLLASGTPAATALATIAFVVVLRHRENFKRMLAGEELAFARRKEKMLAGDGKADGQKQQETGGKRQ